MLKIAAVIVLLLVGLGAAAYAITGGPSSGGQAPRYLTATASRGNVVRSAVATGTVGAVSTYGLSFGQQAQLVTSTTAAGNGGGGTWLVSAVDVKAGDTVHAGDILARADASSLTVQLEVASANLASANAKLETDQGGPSADVVASAQDSVTQAQQSYSAVVTSRKDAQASNNLSVAQAQQALKNAETQLATDKAGPTSETIASAKDSVTQAELSVKNAQQSLLDLQAQDQLTLQGAQSSLQNAQQSLADLQAQDALTLQAAQNQWNDAYSKYYADLKAGDPLAVQADLVAIANAKANVATVQAKIEAAERQAQTQIDSAQAGLASTQLKIASSERQAQTQVDSAQQALTAAQHNYALKVTPSTTVIAADEQAVTNARSNLTAAIIRAQTASHSAENQVTSAQASVAAAEHNYATKVAPASAAQIAQDQAAVASAKAAIATAQQALDLASLTAPVDGTVVSVNLASGSLAPSGYAVVVQTAQLTVTAQFTETDIASLALGQPATVTITAVNQVIDATVSSVAAQPTSSSSGSSVVTYNVVLALANPPASVRVGMSASVSVTTAQVSDVIAVPSVALRGSAGNYSILVLDASGQAQSVPVEVGLIANGSAEISSGLGGGETVVTGTVSARQGTTTTTGAGFGVPGLGGGGFGGGTRGGGTGGTPPGGQP